MQKDLIETGVNASEKLLNSGHIVVTTFMFLTVILVFMVVWLFRLWQLERAENRRLIDLLFSTQESTINAVKELRELIKELAAKIDALLRTK